MAALGSLSLGVAMMVETQWRGDVFKSLTEPPPEKKKRQRGCVAYKQREKKWFAIVQTKAGRKHLGGHETQDEARATIDAYYKAKGTEK
jgi:hypothetical protein